MARELYAIANFLEAQVTLTNVESDHDLSKVDPNAVVHTGGKDGNYCLIPQCSGPEYFQDHHMLVEGGRVKVSSPWPCGPTMRRDTGSITA